MIEMMIGTILAAAVLVWLSTKTSNGGFQKLFVVLGLLLIAVSFVEASALLPAPVLVNETTNFSYMNVTDANGTSQVVRNQSVTIYNYDQIEPEAQSIKDGNMALFIIFVMVVFITIVWVFIDLLGITVDELGRLSRQKPKGG